MVEDVAGPVQDPARHQVHRRRLPVVGDDPVSLAEHVSQTVDADECRRDVPRGLHRLGQPLRDAALVLRRAAQVSDQVAHLGGAALALHEQHAVELQRRGTVQVLGALVGAQRGPSRGFGHRPVVRETLQAAGVALQRDGELARRGRVELLVLAVELGQVQHGLEQRRVRVRRTGGGGCHRSSLLPSWG
ncbi:MAG: hypothetical protein ACXVXE_10915 [Nocardioidaceae bacterium]